MAKQAITLKIAGINIPFTIDSEKEEVYRLAEREVNGYLTSIKQRNIKDWTDRNYLVMPPLRFAIDSVNQPRQPETDDNDLRQHEALSTEIDAYLNTFAGH
ncbi:MAG: cell division protein ZapA [Alistipes sp.]|nr:cell division protein ZapA [Alistipes sp.]